MRLGRKARFDAGNALKSAKTAPKRAKGGKTGQKCVCTEPLCRWQRAPCRCTSPPGRWQTGACRCPEAPGACPGPSCRCTEPPGRRQSGVGRLPEAPCSCQSRPCICPRRPCSCTAGAGTRTERPCRGSKQGKMTRQRAWSGSWSPESGAHITGGTAPHVSI